MAPRKKSWFFHIFKKYKIFIFFVSNFSFFIFFTSNPFLLLFFLVFRYNRELQQQLDEAEEKVKDQQKKLESFTNAKDVIDVHISLAAKSLKARRIYSELQFIRLIQNLWIDNYFFESMTCTGVQPRRQAALADRNRKRHKAIASARLSR